VLSPLSTDSHPHSYAAFGNSPVVGECDDVVVDDDEECDDDDERKGYLLPRVIPPVSGDVTVLLSILSSPIPMPVPMPILMSAQPLCSDDAICKAWWNRRRSMSPAFITQLDVGDNGGGGGDDGGSEERSRRCDDERRLDLGVTLRRSDGEMDGLDDDGGGGGVGL
jgi:hypothetical protein